MNKFKISLIALLIAAIPFTALARTKLVEITPALASFSTPYSANDTLGGLNTVLTLVPMQAPLEALGSLVLIDASKQKIATDVLFFTSSVTLSADNAAFSISDADALKFIGSVSIAAGDYIDSAANSMATKRGLSLLIPQSGGQTIYCVFVTRGTPTYGSASDLVARMTFYEE